MLTTFSRLIRSTTIGPSFWFGCALFTVLFSRSYETAQPRSFLFAILSFFLLALGLWLHEVGHALAAGHFGMPLKEIRLNAFGGYALSEGYFPSPVSVILFGAAGPFMSALVLLFWLLFPGPETGDFSILLGQQIKYSAIVLGFNLFPLLPLDGGKVVVGVRWLRGFGKRILTAKEGYAVAYGQILKWFCRPLVILTLIVRLITGTATFIDAPLLVILFMFAKGEYVAADEAAFKESCQYVEHWVTKPRVYTTMMVSLLKSVSIRPTLFTIDDHETIDQSQYFVEYDWQVDTEGLPSRLVEVGGVMLLPVSLEDLPVIHSATLVAEASDILRKRPGTVYLRVIDREDSSQTLGYFGWPELCYLQDLNERKTDADEV